MTAAHPAPLFILSFRQRDELASLAAGAGWQVVAARRAGGAERRFLSSGAAVAVIDARGAPEDGLGATTMLSGAVEANGGAMLVLVSRGEVGTISALFEAGATHFLASPFSEAEFLQALRFAARHAERMAREWAAGPVFTALGWRYDLAAKALVLTPGLMALLAMDREPGVRDVLRRLEPGDRAAALAALRRMSPARPATAFAHDAEGIGRIVQHLQWDVDRQRIDAVVEPLGSAPEPAAELREALAGARDAGSARRWLARQLESPSEIPLHTMLVALNRFDMVNTAYGRAAGDALLRSAQKRIDDVVREMLGRDGLIARMSGSTFVVAARAPRLRIDLALARIAGELARPFVTGESIAVLGCRIGLAQAQEGDTAATLLRRASEALAEARESDSATMRVADADGDGAPIDRLAVELNQAMDRGEIGILFQPQVSVSSGEIIGVEALARWEHRALGTIGAETLFAAAARADLDIGLSDHIQKLVLAQAAAWPASLGGLRLSLNLTAGDIARPGFADLFLDRVDSSGFPRARLTLEITESGLIEDLGIASSLLSVLRGAGCRIAIDDFGTGYSSLAYLKALPLDYLKIDKKLAQDITGSPRDRVVVRGVIDMARSLGLTVIAEGVENEAQLEALAAEGCQIYQGFLCSEAVSVAALVALVTG
ncbi:putative bifunctional diguanylate cyclase/phosphodiesterase [Sphingomonas sp.]|jgi:EAL domain-containing protein (putative c-di-GMP-specific phosphodiesterase class I)/CheY-like chemotaxis protein|uniref:putative bifunctional diguanylate cyclase/phosphodiesterase n=1 Tax=Sphingomonas sp. TaxID=28214 RepID=UPI003562D48E